MLNYLRTGTLPSFDAAWRYEEVAEEADFFALEALKVLAESVRSKLQLSLLETSAIRPCVKMFAWIKLNSRGRDL